MKVAVETVTTLERKLTITLPGSEVSEAIEKRIKQLAPKVRVDGFRPGKVPARVVRQRFGSEIEGEVLSEQMSESFQKAVTQEHLKIAGQPTVTPKTFKAGTDFSFVAEFEVFPHVVFELIKDKEIDRPVVDITDDDVDAMIERLREQNATFEPVERAAQDGDKLTVDYQGRKGDELFEGGSASDARIEIGSNSMIPGFESGLIGLSAGDQKTLSLTFPEDYHAEDLKGQAVMFDVTVKSIESKVLPEVNDDFLKDIGFNGQGIAAFKEDAQKNMEHELAESIKGHIKRQVLDAVLDVNALELPKALIKQEIDALRQQSIQQFQGRLPKNLDFNALLPDEHFQENAAKRVKLGLLLSSFVEEQNLEPTDEQVKQTVEKIAQRYDAAQSVIDYYYEKPERLESVHSMVLEDLAIEQLLTDAQVIDVPMSYQELMDKVGGNG